MIDIEKVHEVTVGLALAGLKRIDISADDVLELLSRVKKSEKDAARYQFMRDSGRFLETGSDFDAVVDEAMKCKQK